MGILNIRDLSYEYEGADNFVFEDINIEFELGKIYSIVGKSGAGKTTFLSLISGLDNYKNGDIIFKDTQLKNIDKDKYRSQDIGVIFQSYNLLTNSTALENIVLSMEISKVKCDDKKAFAISLLESVGINLDKANRKILKLSGGEQQRVAIARALSHNPDIIIADEPTGNLDAETEQEILSILKKLAHEKNTCVIIVTHSNVVSSIADETWGLADKNLLFIK